MGGALVVLDAARQAVAGRQIAVGQARTWSHAAVLGRLALGVFTGLAFAAGVVTRAAVQRVGARVYTVTFTPGELSAGVDAGPQFAALAHGAAPAVEVCAAAVRLLAALDAEGGAGGRLAALGAGSFDAGLALGAGAAGDATLAAVVPLPALDAQRFAVERLADAHTGAGAGVAGLAGESALVWALPAAAIVAAAQAFALGRAYTLAVRRTGLLVATGTAVQRAAHRVEAADASLAVGHTCVDYALALVVAGLAVRTGRAAGASATVVAAHAAPTLGLALHDVGVRHGEIRFDRRVVGHSVVAVSRALAFAAATGDQQKGRY